MLTRCQIFNQPEKKAQQTLKQHLQIILPTTVRFETTRNEAHMDKYLSTYLYILSKLCSSEKYVVVL